MDLEGTRRIRAEGMPARTSLNVCREGEGRFVPVSVFVFAVTIFTDFQTGKMPATNEAVFLHIAYYSMVREVSGFQYEVLKTSLLKNQDSIFAVLD